MLKRGTARGFTLVELMVGLTIVGIILAIGVPSFASFLQSAKLANSAQSYLAGIRMARAAAIQRNAPVTFLLTNDPVHTPALAVAAVPSITGKNWVVSWFNPDPLVAAVELIEAKPAIEGSFTSTGVAPVQVIGTAVAPAVFNGAMVFNGFGVTTGSYVLSLSNPSGGACAPLGPMRCPAVWVTTGGQSKVCDPIAAAGDSRAC